MKPVSNLPMIKVSSVITRGVAKPHPELVQVLADSIKGLNYQLLHPITVDTRSRLIAGNHRLAAFKRLGLEEIEPLGLTRGGEWSRPSRKRKSAVRPEPKTQWDLLAVTR